MSGNSGPDGDRPSRSRRRFVRTIGAASVAALAGCGGGGPGATETEGGDVGDGGDGGDGDGGAPAGTTRTGEATVQMAMPPPVTQNSEATKQALHDAGLADNITVEFLATSELSGDVQSQYRQWLSAGREQPDVFRMDSGWTIPFIVRDQLVNLSEHLSDEAKSLMREHYFQAPLSTAKAPENTPGGSETDQGTGTVNQGILGGGDIYGVPWQVGFPTVQYRKDLVTDAGFDPEGENWATEPMTWQRFGEVISQTMEQSDVDYGFAWQGNDYVGLSCCTFNEFMSTWGGAYFGGRENLFGPVGERPITVTDESVVNALRMARTFVQGSDDSAALDPYGKISPDAVLQWTEGPSISAFTEGNAVALRYWPSAIPQANEAFGDDFGVMPIPYAVSEEESEYDNIGGTASALGGWHLTVNPHSQNISAAVDVIEATMTESFREFEFNQLGFLTADRRLFGEEVAGDVWAPHMETLRIAGNNSIPRPVTVVWPDQSPLISREVNAALAAQKAPQQALQDLESALEDVEAST